MKWKAFFIIFEGLGESPTLNNPETIENIVHMIRVTGRNKEEVELVGTVMGEGGRIWEPDNPNTLV